MCGMYNILNIENFFFIGVIIFYLYIIVVEPYNIISYSIYLALYYIPINIMTIIIKKRDNIYIQDFEMAHRLLLIIIGLIPIIGLFNKKTNELIRFR
jgi:hypothetical protein